MRNLNTSSNMENNPLSEAHKRVVFRGWLMATALAFGIGIQIGKALEPGNPPKGQTENPNCASVAAPSPKLAP
jgi:hypothetical protein